jgi:release factor glutamine methyltransferase
MTTVAEALRAAAARLEPVAGSGRLDATLLLEHVTGADRVAFVREGERAFDAAAQQRLDELVARRIAGVPIAYLTGSAGFFGRSFAVDERVLVPRPETEHLVEAVLAGLRARDLVAPTIAEVGTGSGALAVTLALELPAAGVFASDVSADALAVARVNAARHGVAQRCTFLHGDLAAPLVRFAPVDAVVANLPYVPAGEVPRVPDPAGYEPRLALDGGADGLALYRRLVAALPLLLRRGGAGAWFEAGPGTAEPLAGLVAATLPWARVRVLPDYAGRLRVVAAEPA